MRARTVCSFLVTQISIISLASALVVQEAKISANHIGQSSQEPEDVDDRGNPPSKRNQSPDDIWHEVSSYSNSTAATIACLWVTMVAGMPVIVVQLERGKLTRTRMTIFATMWFVFFGGIYLFTNVILFQSVHFKRIRHLNIIEAVYFLAQILTTVGYGDITPAREFGQVFVGLYVIFSVMIIANIASEAMTLLQKKAREYAHEVAEKRLHIIQEDHHADLKTQILGKAEMPSLHWGPFFSCAGAFTFFVFTGVMFFHYFPGENKSFQEAVYMSIITLSTVGFGAFTPSTEEGKVFAAFWMVFGSSSVVGLVGSFTAIAEQVKSRELYDPEKQKKAVEEMSSQLQHKDDKFEFLKAVLLYQGVKSEKELEDIEKLYLSVTPRSTNTKTQVRSSAGDSSKRLQNA